MAKLYLKFEQAVLKEYPLARGVATIGRLPDNLIQVDNLAVSGHHARIYWDAGRYIVEDSQSLNGTYLNQQRIATAVLKNNDEILIGKHTLIFRDGEAGETAEATSPALARPVPSINSTVMLDSKKMKDVAGRVPASGSLSAKARERHGLLTIISGRTDERQYTLSGKLSVIGKSSMASIRLKGWFAPQAAAVINRRDDKYVIAPSGKKSKVRVNGESVQTQKELAEGDVVEVAGIKATFSYSD